MSVTDRLGDDAVFSFDRVFGPKSQQEDVFEVGRCRLKPPELKARWLRKWGRPPMDHYFLTLIYGGGPLCTFSA
jgi:hypothetical protein